MVPAARWTRSRLRRAVGTIDRLGERLPHTPWWERQHVIRSVRRYRQHAARTQARREAFPQHLHNYERSVYSQNGEDGIIAEVLGRLDLGGGFLVEIGAAAGDENCTRALIEGSGWTGVWFEADPALAAVAREVAPAPTLRVVEARVDKDNVEGLLDEAEVPRDLELLVLDIDGNDWWVLESILRSFSPRFIVVEYNASVGFRDWVLPYDPQASWDYDDRHGASLLAFDRLLSGKGYALVGCDSCGVNAFFVRQADAGRFLRPGDVEFHHAPMALRAGMGHSRSPMRHRSMPALEPDELDRVAVGSIEVLDDPPLGFVDLVATVRNGTAVELVSGLVRPLHAVAWWGGGDDRPESVLERFPLLWPIRPGRSGPVHLRLPLPPDRRDELTVAIVQEDVRWLTETTTVAFTGSRGTTGTTGTTGTAESTGIGG